LYQKKEMAQNINYQRIEQAIQFLSKNINHPPDLDDVARQVHLSVPLYEYDK
jgi:AraC-like DNA-binding protein